MAGYAALASESKGRVYPEEEHPLRTAFQRDRDRVVHSAAFRRMEYKTQVFIPHEKDHCRTLARNLRLNEDLTEAIALVHDLGHTPFGHSGEDVLDELLQDLGGFNHNRQSLRVVDILEQRYPEHPGLNLSYEVREGIVKHETKVKITSPRFAEERWPTLEASLVDKADEIAYNAHDIDDGLSSGLIALDDLRDLSVWRQSDGLPGLSLADAGLADLDYDQRRYQLVRFLIDRLATELLNETQAQLVRLSVVDLDSVRNARDQICGYSNQMAKRVRELKEFLHVKLYRHPSLMKHAQRAHVIIRGLFKRLTIEPKQMPRRFQDMLMTEPVEMVVADYIAGMTDRYAEKLCDEPNCKP